MSVSAAALTAVALLAANGFFVASEFALVAARRSRIERLAASGDRRAAHALAGVRELSLMLAGAQLGITMASLGLGAVAEPALARVLEHWFTGAGVPEGLTHALAFTIALAIVVYLHMVVGEMAPKSWAIAHPERSALLLARPFRAFTLVFRPAIRLLNTLANGVVRLWGLQPREELALIHSAGDLLMLVEESAREGMLHSDQEALLSRALELTELDAEAVMVPRRDIVAVPATATVPEVERVATDTGRSRLPVFEGDLDRVSGVVHVKDLLRLDDAARAVTTAGDLARPPFVTVESRPIPDLMVDMRQQRAHLAIVVDEYGSVSGLVALEDVLEELIGEFEDESDRRLRRHAHTPRRREDGAMLVPGALRPDELEERTGVELPSGDYETVAGFVIAELGRVPAVGDVAEFDGHRIEVTRMDGHRVLEVAVARA